MTRYIAWMAAVAFFVAAACAARADGYYPTRHGHLLPKGYLSTRGNQIVDSSGKPVRIDSVGWAGTQIDNQAMDGLANASYQSMIDGIVKDGFNCTRISWTDAGLHSTSGLMPDSVDYKKNPDLVGLTQMQMLDKVIAYAGKVGLKVILDHHSDEGHLSAGQQANGLWYDLGPGTDGTDGAGDPGTVTAAGFDADWVTIAKRYAGNRTVIGFDLDNEPSLSRTNGLNWGKGGTGDIWAAYTRAGDAIQKVDPGALIICEGAQDDFNSRSDLLWGRYDLSHVASKPIVLTIPGKVLYSVHEYPAEVSARRPDHGLSYIKVMNAQWGYLEARNIAPVWIGEMGAPLNRADTDGRAWAATLLPYVDGLYGFLGGPVFHGDQQPVSTDWWAWGYVSAGPGWGTLSSWDPVEFDKTEKALTDQLSPR